MAKIIDRIKAALSGVSPDAIGQYIQESQIYRSVFRVGVPDSDRKRMLVMLGSVFLHLHPVKVRKSGIRMRYTWCMGGITFFLFLVLTFTGLLLMFYYRPTLEYAYVDIIDSAQVPSESCVRSTAGGPTHSNCRMLHMHRVFMTAHAKPPRGQLERRCHPAGFSLLLSSPDTSCHGISLRCGRSRSAATWLAPPFLGNEGTGPAVLEWSIRGPTTVMTDSTCSADGLSVRARCSGSTFCTASACR